MNFFSRLGRGIIIMMPTGVVAFVLMYGAWRWQCDSHSCRVVNLITMLTGLALGIWSLIVLAASIVDGNPEKTMRQAFLVNLTNILPNVLGYAAFAGFMAWYSFTLFKEHLARTDMSENKLLFMFAVFLPLYELTRVFERKKSIARKPDDPVLLTSTSKPGFTTYVLLHAQSYITFGVWQHTMLLILKNRELLPAFEKAAKLQFLYLIAVMAAASFILYRCYEWIENFLRAQKMLPWNSRYFGKS